MEEGKMFEKTKSKKNKQQKKKQKDEQSSQASNLVWTDDEVQLLLETIIHYKAQKAADTDDWETVKSKYDDITEMFLKNIPTDSKELFPHDLQLFTKDRITTKIKQIRTNYRKTLDLGRKSGGGRLVTFFYDRCSDIWSGSPATTSMSSGIENDQSAQEISTNSIDDDYQGDIGGSDNANNELSTGTSLKDSDNTSDFSLSTSASSMNESSVDIADFDKPKSSREEMQEMLKNRRNKKLTKKLPGEKRASSDSDTEFRQRIVDRMERQDALLNETMKSFQQNMAAFTQTMTNSYQMMMTQMFSMQAPHNGFNQSFTNFLNDQTFNRNHNPSQQRFDIGGNINSNSPSVNSPSVNNAISNIAVIDSGNREKNDERAQEKTFFQL